MPNTSSYNLSKRDEQVIWHPFTQHQIEPHSIAITHGEGVYLYDEAGNRYIDAISSWWVNLHGHAHPYLAEKIYEQALKIEQVIFAGFTHEPAVRLSERILGLLPAHFQKVFFSDNGSTAVEVAIKMALQYFHNQGNTRKRKIIALADAYHGDTFGAMSLGAPSAFNAPFQEMLFDVEFIPSPTDPAACLKALEEKMRHAEDYAAFIFEPLVQGAGGMAMYSAETLDSLIACAQANQVMCIADEIMTGFGRTGKFFAIDHGHQKPDIMCLSKGLTGGTMAMGLTICSDDIFNAFLSTDRHKTLFHSHSFTANPLTCAAANASLDLMEAEGFWEKIEAIRESHTRWIQQTNHPALKNLRQTGTILAFELVNGEADDYMNPIRGRAYAHFIKKGVLLRPLGNTIYVLAPYCISQTDLDYIYTCILEFANELVG